MGYSDRHTCCKCSARNCRVEHVPAFSNTTHDEPTYYNYYGGNPSLVLTEHLRVVCRECGFEWIVPVTKAAPAKKKGRNKR